MSGTNQRATVTRIKSRELIEAERKLSKLHSYPVPTDPELRAIHNEACRLMQESVNACKHADALRAFMLWKFGPNPQASAAQEIAP